jgi:hypothetical protein
VRRERPAREVQEIPARGLGESGFAITCARLNRQAGEGSPILHELVDPAFEEVVRSRDDDDLAGVPDELDEKSGRSEGVALPGHEERRHPGPRQTLDWQRGEGKADGDQRRGPRVDGGRPERHRRAEGKPGREDRQAAAPDGLVQGRPEVVDFAAPLVVPPLRLTDATKVEAQRGISRRGQRPGGVVDDLVVRPP